ncbi:type II toxin-antitoxin system VapC family toxin [Nocardia yunnanensis]|uniref:Ribonuclease VapC n=1 Tax=Nocardia yunnanensis TaxID=2382165 RepID=A0A386ZLF7_9NOCA|nr:type II toxin-antitoxin system VapC family toxin [Nocardia yunnanensis]AYF78120.1 type II toxin-antitoxin system VapC family toxin [Nocardia yunnanensis]
MIILDTNVISEPTTKAPNARVLEWLDAQVTETLYLTAVTVGELRYGIAAMPEGRRRDEYTEWLEKYTVPAFAGRILPYDLEATAEYARLMSGARAAGIAIGTADGMIAATAAAAGFTVATRDTTPFEAAGVTIIDPWNYIG